ncbi:MAG: fasciclin domain-containing protein [Bacteroidales bacterium]|nr:fasciclin domain-containing protein [Bacteroidales bacterium]MBN2762586.1 fasciclin domain-containing protein [Bacteroidales bacterium]
MKTKHGRNVFIKSIWLLFIALVFNCCKEDIQELPRTNDQLVIAEYIALNSDFSLFNELLLDTKLNNLLSIRGPYSLFLPNNEAISAYCSEKGIQSVTDLDSLEKRDLVYNHIVPAEYSVSDYQLGTLAEKNALGDNIVTEFQEAEIIINKTARIIKRDVRVSNGTIQIIDKVLDPVKLSVIDVLAADPSYSIFAAGLENTGLRDTLDIISFQYGQTTARTRYTILAIADTTFNRFGINSYDDLVARFTNAPDSITFQDNAFYQYMDYHCLDKEAYYLSDFPYAATLYSVLSKNNNLQIKIDNGIYKINTDAADNSYTGIYTDQSNIPAKNGVIHTVNDLLEVATPSPTTIIWEVTDYFDFKQGEYYLNHFEKFFDPYKFEGIRWQGEYLQYYIKAAKDAQTQLNDDCLNMIGFWEIEVTTPKIMKGRYTVASRVWTGIEFAVFIDGEQTRIVLSSDVGTITGAVTSDTQAIFNFGEVNWTTSTQHKIKLVALKSGTLFWDRMEFIPVK